MCSVSLSSGVLYQINEICPVFDAENTGGQGNPARTIRLIWYKDGWERKKAGGLAPSTFYEKKDSP